MRMRILLTHQPLRRIFHSEGQNRNDVKALIVAYAVLSRESQCLSVGGV